MRFDPILFFLLLAQGPTAFDLPFGIGLYEDDKPARLVAAARHAKKWAPRTRRVFDLVLVEPQTNLVTRIRSASLTRAWWTTLADELDRCPLSLARKEYEATIQAAYGRWKEPLAMIPDCAALEQAGI